MKPSEIRRDAVYRHIPSSSDVKVIRANQDSDGDIIVENVKTKKQFYCKPHELQDEGPVPTAVPAAPKYDTSVLTSSNTECFVTPNETKGNTEMTNTTRSTVEVILLDNDAGLKPEDALVANLGSHVIENGNTTHLQQKLLMDVKLNVAEKLSAHNAKREKTVDLDILKRTGNEVTLRPIEIHEIEWQFK